MFVFDDDGTVLTSVPHLSPTGYEYPIVADVVVASLWPRSS